MRNDFFGLNDEERIRKSGVRKVFTPHTPINTSDHFFGRDEDVRRIITVVNTPGQHILVYGDRGVGKTSLAKTTCSLLLSPRNNERYLLKICDRSDTFSTLFVEALERVNCDISVEDVTKGFKCAGKAGINLGFANSGVDGEFHSSTTYRNHTDLKSPSWLANKVKSLDCIFLLDEVDTLIDDEDRKKLAELIKLLSDLDSKFKIIIVGIATTGSELTAGHQSIQRCLKEIHLKRMTDDDIKKIVVNGMNKIGKIPKEEVVDKIVNISSGFPHFAHLICLKCAEIAVTSNKTHIELDILDQALVEAARDSEDTLSNTLNSMLRETNSPQEYKLILLAASYCQRRDFRSRELSDRLSELFGTDISSSSLSSRLKKLTEPYNGNTILSRTARGFFTFTDPRMASFIKILFNTSNRVRLDNAS